MSDMSAQTTEEASPQEQETTGSRLSWLRTPLIIAAILVLFAVTYGFAWRRAYTLSETFMQNAQASFEQGDFVDALSGYDTYDEATGSYVFQGGYAQVVNIWNNSYAWPVPATVEDAEQRIDEIINQHLTLADAEGFIQANTGRASPYLGAVYLRTGELYEQDDPRNAQEVYETIPELFPNQPELVEQAEERLSRLEQGGQP